MFKCAIITLFALVFLSSLTPSSSATAKKTAVEVTVFIHGSVFVGVGLLNLIEIIKGNLSTDCSQTSYGRILSSMRDGGSYEFDACAQGVGMHLVPPIGQEVHENVISLLVGLYDICAQEAAPHLAIDRVYYTFGHYGLLSHSYRGKAAGELYRELCNVRTQLQGEYEHIIFKIVAHSHGGNIALLLVEQEQVRMQELTIDTLCMFGTPLQVETINYAYDPLFRRVINCYAPADEIQRGDWASTKARFSAQSFHDKRLKLEKPLRGRACEIELRACDSKKQVDHVNMWVTNRSMAIFAPLDPCPYMVMSPHLMAAAELRPGASLLADLIHYDGKPTVKVYEHNAPSVRTSIYGAPFSEAFQQARNALINQWKYGKEKRTSYLDLKKGLDAFWQAVHHNSKAREARKVLEKLKKKAAQKITLPPLPPVALADQQSLPFHSPADLPCAQ